MRAVLLGQAGGVGAAAVKAVLMYATALIGLRLSYRRTLSQWTAMDFAAAVAVGAIVGRTAIAADQSWLTGAVALVALLVLGPAAPGCFGSVSVGHRRAASSCSANV